MRILRLGFALLLLSAAGLCAAPARAGLFTAVPAAAPGSVGGTAGAARTKLKHLIFIVQESRSFDHFFGTFPGADGIPTNPPCQIDPQHPSACDTPYPDHKAGNMGGPSTNAYQVQDVDGGKMDGFVESAEQAESGRCGSHCKVDVMGFHDGTDLPNYWAYASAYTLFDHFYESVEAWSLPAHLALFSGWSASCTQPAYQASQPNVDDCASSFDDQTWSPAGDGAAPTPYLWTDITYLLHQHAVSWNAYLDGGLGPPIGPPDTEVQGIWIPLGGFETVVDDGQYPNAIGSTALDFRNQALAGTLPQVSWVIPNYLDSDQPQASIKTSQSYVTSLVNAVMKGPDWDSSAILIVWDNMGGFYDHEPPPFALDSEGPGLRVGSILISPYAKAGFIDHRIATTDSYLKLIEDVFLDGERISQSGRPDPRPDYRDQAKRLSDLLDAFDFSAPPRPALVLSTHPMTLLEDDAASAARGRAVGTRRR